MFIFQMRTGKRDQYVRKRREARNKKSGDGAKNPTKWRFLDTMSFLDSYVEEAW